MLASMHRRSRVGIGSNYASRANAVRWSLRKFRSRFTVNLLSPPAPVFLDSRRAADFRRQSPRETRSGNLCRLRARTGFFRRRCIERRPVLRGGVYSVGMERSRRERFAAIADIRCDMAVRFSASSGIIARALFHPRDFIHFRHNAAFPYDFCVGSGDFAIHL